MLSAPVRKFRVTPRATAFFFLAAVILGAPAGARAQSAPAHTPKPIGPPLDITVPIGPTAFKADGKWHLVYELHVTNLGKWDSELTCVDVMTTEAPPKSIASFADAALGAMIFHPGIESADKALEAGKKSRIGAGMFAVVYMWVTFDRLEDVPKLIRHRIEMKIGDYPEAITLDGVPVTVNRNPVIVISPPLRGENWLAGNGPSNMSIHRRAFIPINGRAHISQRFAIDWVQIYPDGKTFHGDRSDNKNYRAYGAEIHAVADGIVASAKDGIQQNTPGAKSLAVPITLETIGGNHVIVEIGNGLYAFYAHMQQGSVRVKVGDKVRRGDVLGLLGNSGNSSEPHLHFQICDANSELGSEGLPYAFASYDQQGTGSISDASPSATFFPVPVMHELELPLENEIVRFSP